NQSLRPGLGPVQVDVTSSNGSVGTISNHPVTLRATASATQPSITFTPTAIGQTDIAVIQPAGFVPIPGLSTVTVNVPAPGFAAGSILLGKDLVGQAGVSLASNVVSPLINFPITLTSSDPSRVLLGADAASAPAATLSSVLVAGHSSTGSFYVHALGNSGI